jgi:hypothetical protein
LWLHKGQWGVLRGLENIEEKTMNVTDNIIDLWSENWVRANDTFEKILQIK